jgi:hypothetical protein
MNEVKFHIALSYTAGQFLMCYGPTKEENEWTTDIKKAFKLTYKQLDARLPVVRKHFPTAVWVEAK